MATGIQEYSFPWAFSKHKPRLMGGTMWRKVHLTILHISNHQTSRFYIHHTTFLPFSTVSSNRKFSNCRSTIDVRLVKLSSERFCGNRGSSRWTLNCTVTFATVGIWFLDTILFNVRRSHSLSFRFWTLFLLADDVFPWFVYAVITLETGAMDTPNKVAILVTDAPAKCTQTICPLSKFDESLIL